MAAFFDDPFTTGRGIDGTAPSGTPVQGFDSLVDSIAALQGRSEQTPPTAGPLGQEDSADPFPDTAGEDRPEVARKQDEGVVPGLLSQPLDERGPTAFQRMEINWADGGEKADTPRPYKAGDADFLEVDYTYGRKKGATNEPILAANVFGRQFTEAELQQDDEGRRLLELMAARRAGTYNSGGSLANFGRGWADWSKSDIPFYGWMSDIGVSISEAIDMSKTIRKLQDGEKVTPHEAIAVRRYMLQQELEGTRTMAYNVGAVVRQAVPFMAEMAATSAVGAALGSIVAPGLGTLTGGAAGALVGAAKWLFTGGRAAAKAGTRYLVSSTVAEIARRMARGEAVSLAERQLVMRAGRDVFGKAAFRTLRGEVAAELGTTASRRTVTETAVKRFAGRFAEADAVPEAARGLATKLVEADTANAVGSGAMEAMRKWALNFAKTRPAEGAGAREIDRAVREGIANATRTHGAAWVHTELSNLSKGFTRGLVREIGGAGGTLDATQTVAQSIARASGSLAVEDRLAETVTRSILSDAARNFELRYGTRGFLATPERFLRFAFRNAQRGFLQSEHSFVRGGLPTIGHAGFTSFNRSWDALAEGIGRTMIQAPIQAGIQLGVAAPVFAGVAAASGADLGDVTFRGQLGEQLDALVTGDRDRMDHARMVALGQMFTEYWSENSGRGLGLLAGGAASGLAGKTPLQVARYLKGARDTFITPISRRTGETLSKAVEAVFGYGDIRRMSLDRVKGLAERYVSRAGFRSANRADIARIVETRSLDGVDGAFRRELESKGVKSAKDLVTNSVMAAERFTKGQAARAYLGYVMMQKGVTPDRIVRAFRQMGKGGGIIEEMGEERFGDFIKGLFHLDDSASNATLADHMKNAFSGWTDADQLATEFLGFAFPGIARGASLRLQSWMGQGGLARTRDATSAIVRITDAASSRRTAQVAVEGLDEKSRRRYAAWDEAKAAELDRNLGTTEANRAKVGANAAAHRALAADPSQWERFEADLAAAGAQVREGQNASVRDTLDRMRASKTDEAAADAMAEAAKEIAETSGTEQELEANIQAFGGEALFGPDGVDAIRKEWRKADGHAFSKGNAIEQSLSEYNRLVHDGPGRMDFENGHTADEWARHLVTYAPFAGRNNAQTAEERERAAQGSDTGVDLVGAGAREELADAVDEMALRLGRAESELEPSMSWGRRALIRLAGLPAAIVSGDLSFAAANPAAWLAADVGVPLHLREAARNAYREALLHGYRELESQFDAGLKARLNEALANGTDFAVALQDAGVDTATVRRMEEAGAAHRRALISAVSQEYLAASGVLSIAQSDLAVPAVRLARDQYVRDLPEADREAARRMSDADFARDHANLVDDAKSQIVEGVFRIVRDQHAAYYASNALAGRNGFTISVDALRAVNNGTKEEVLAAILRLPAFKGVQGVVDVSGNAALTQDALGAMAHTADVDRILSLQPGADGRYPPEALAEIVEASGRRADMYPEEDNQRFARTWVAQLALMREGALTTLSNADGAVSAITPTMEGGVKSWSVRTANADGTVATTNFGSFEAARGFAESQGYSVNHMELTVSSVREVLSRDATSAVFFAYGNDRDVLRRAYLNQLGGRHAVELDARRLPQTSVVEQQLPPYLRRVITTSEDGEVLSNDWEYKTAEEAAAQLRTERTTDPEAFKRYESVSGQMAASLGIVRRATGAAVGMGLGSGAWVMRVDGGYNQDRVVLSPDFASEGNSEAMLRAGLRNAIDVAVRSPDAGREGRGRLFADAYVEFMAARDRVLDALRRTDMKRYNQVKAVFDEQFPPHNGVVSTGAIAHLAAASVFFTSERGLRQEGRGFFGSPEVAAVADEFRSSPIYPLFVSAIDEALGGNGFFRRTAGSLNGLARWLQAFAPDARDLSDARNSPVFTPDGSAKRNPYLVRYSFAAGVASYAKDAEGQTLRADTFDGNLARGYIRSVSDSCHSIATALADADGLPADGGYTSAEAYERLRRAALFGGSTQTAQNTPPAPQVKVTGFDLVATESGLKALEKDAGLQGPQTIDGETARNIGSALRLVFQAAGGRFTEGRRAATEFMRDRGVPEDSIQAILNGFDSSELVEEREAGEPEMSETEARIEEREASGGADGTDKMDHESNIKQWASNADVRAVSDTVKWLFPLEGGDVSALFVRAREALRRVPTGGLPAGDAGAIRDFAEAMNPFADPERAEARIAGHGGLISEPDGKVLTATLDRVIGALARAGMYADACTLAAVRQLPHNRRLKVLQMWSQLTPVGHFHIARSEETYGDRRFHVATRGSFRNDARSVNAMESIWSSLMSSPILKGADTREKIAERIALAETVLQDIDSKTVDAGFRARVEKAFGFKVEDVRRAVDAVRALNPASIVTAKIGKNSTVPLFAVDKADFDALAEVKGQWSEGTRSASSYAELKRNLDPAAVRRALDGIQTLTRRRMEALAPVIDMVYGQGSDAVQLLRSPDSLSFLRQELEREILFGDHERAQGLLNRFLDFTNEFAAVESAKWEGNRAGPRQLYPASRFLVETVQEPFAGLGLRLTGSSNEQVLSGKKVSKSAAAGIQAIMDRESRFGSANVQEASKEYLRSERRHRRTADTVALRARAYAAGLPAEVTRGYVRQFLRGMAAVKAATNTSPASGVTPADSLEIVNAKFKADAKRPPDNLLHLINTYTISMPRNSQRIGGVARNAVEGSENRTITTLPSQVPAFLRACSSELFSLKVDGASALDTLKANGLRWADGSHPVAAVLGTLDEGNLVDRMHLAGLANRAIMEDIAYGGLKGTLAIPLFRGDKSSMYSLTIPSYLAKGWVEAAKDGKVKVSAALKRFIQSIYKRGGDNLDGILSGTAEGSDALDSTMATSWDDLDDKGRGIQLRADFYRAVYGLVAAASGQDRIDPKRVAVNLSIGPIIPMRSAVRAEGIEGVIWAHPSSGKTYIAKAGSRRYVDFDSQYKSAYLGEMLIGRPFKNEAEKKAFRKNHEAEWEAAVDTLFRRAMNETAAEGKTLLVSDVRILEQHSDEIDRVIDMDEETFVKRSADRGDTNEASMRRWKASINRAVETARKAGKNIEVNNGNLSEYLSATSVQDVLPPPGYYRSTIVGGRKTPGSVRDGRDGATGASMMGGWFVHGSMADKVAAMSDSGSAQAIKVHVYGLNDGVDFDKGQAHDYGLFDGEEGEVSSLASVNWWKRQMRGRVATALGLAEDALEMPQKPETILDNTPEEDQYRQDLEAWKGRVETAKRFLKTSTVGLCDMEVAKAGAFGSRAGVRVEKGAKEIRFGGELVFVSDDGKHWRPSEAVAKAAPWFVLEPEVKNSAAPLVACVAALAAMKGGLSAGDVAAIEGEWTLPDGSVSTGTLGDAGLLPRGSTLSARVVDGAVAVDFFTQSMIAQVVANNSATSEARSGHPFATNLTRDVQVDELLTQAIGGVEARLRSTGFVDAHSAYALLQLAQLQTNRQLLWDALQRDAELSEAVRAFPEDAEVRGAVYEKIKAFVARQMVPSYHGGHGVMVASGLQAKVNRFAHTAEIYEAPGMDGYTRDCYRPALVLGSKAREILGMSRTYASGTVNVRQAGFRYGIYAVDEDLDRYLGGKDIKEYLESGEAQAEIERIAPVFGDDARRAVAIAFAVRRIRDLQRGDDQTKAARELEAFMECFSDYAQRNVRMFPLKDGERLYPRFDDLFLKDGRFDYAALDGGANRRVYRDGSTRLYLGGSFFAAHRSPSGNIEAFSGLARATAPVTYDRRSLLAGAESKYALDPITTNTQGSDTDGDSSGIQVYDYTLEERGGVDAQAIRGFVDAVAGKFVTSSFGRAEVAKGADLAAEVMALARANGWTVKSETADGTEIEVVDPKVLELIQRELLQAQIDNYRRAPTLHQGHFDGDAAGVVANRPADDRRAKDVFDASELVDHREGSGVVTYDTGFVGRSPVGTDAVFESPCTEGDYLEISKAVPGSVMPEYKAGMTMTDLLNGAVEKVSSADVSLFDPTTVARLSDAASDSSNARATSVSLQSRYLRALTERLDTEASGVFADVRANGYSPVADFIAHMDGISNNLFDTLKKMFATRAGWTRDLLPTMVTRIVRHAIADSRKNPDVRIDDKFFARELLLFLAETRDPDSPVGKFITFSNTLTGRDALLGHLDSLMAELRRKADGAKDEEKRTLFRRRVGRIRTVVESVRPSDTVQNIARSLLRSMNQVAVGALRTDEDDLDIGDELMWLCTKLDAIALNRPMTKRELQFSDDVLDGGNASKRAFGDLTDYPKESGRTFAALAKRQARTAPSLWAKVASAGVGAKQAVVSHMFVDWMTEYAPATTEAFVNKLHADVVLDAPDGARIPTVQDTAQNYGRLKHLIGAYRLLIDAVGEANAEKAVTLFGPTTQKFSETLLATVRERTGEALRNATGDMSRLSPVDRLFAAIDANGNELRLNASVSAAEIEDLRRGFQELMGTTERFEVPGTKGKRIMGSTLARLIMVHAAATTDFGARSSYVTQSTLPAVFGDDNVRFMDAYAKNAADAALYMHAPVRIGETGLKATTYDLVANLKPLSRAAGRGVKADRETLASRFAVKQRQETAPTELMSLKTDARFVRRERIGRVDASAAHLYRPSQASYQLVRPVNGKNQAVDAFPLFGLDGRENTAAGRTYSLESAVDNWSAQASILVANAAIARDMLAQKADGHGFPALNEDCSVSTSDDRRFVSAGDSIADWERRTGMDLGLLETVADEAPRYEAETGRMWFDTALSGSRLSRRRIARDILRRAVETSPDLYALLENLDKRIVTGDDAIDAAWAAAARDVRRGRIEDPAPADAPLPPPAAQVRASEEGGDTVEVASIRRADFIRRADALYPGRADITEDQLRKSIPDAIEAAFKRIFGNTVEVKRVLNADGEETNLLRVTRDVNGKKVVTHIAYGESIRHDYSQHWNDRRTIESVVAGLNVKFPGANLSADTILAMPERERKTFLRLVSERARSMGNAGGSLTTNAAFYDPEFAGAMSGLIRLDVDAGFQTLFHEYFHSMLECFRALGISTEEDQAALAAAFPGADGEFNEESAANAYAKYLTDLTQAEGSEVKLRDFYDETGGVSREVQELFSRFRTTSELITRATQRGEDDEGLPIFLRCTFIQGLSEDEMAHLVRTPDEGDLKAVEAKLLGQPVRDTGGMPPVLTVNQQKAKERAWQAISDGDASLLERRMRELQDTLDAPQPAPAQPEPEAPEATGESVEASTARSPDVTPAGRVQAFLRAALRRWTEFPAEAMRTDLAELREASYMHEPVGESIGARRALFGVRRLLRETAAALGIEVERIVERTEADGSVTRTVEPTEKGRALFADEVAVNLANRLMYMSDMEREREAEGKGRDDRARHASAEYAFARALQTVAPTRYHKFALALAKKSSDAFAAAERRCIEAADRAQEAGDAAKAAGLRRKASDLASRSTAVMEFVRATVSGEDFHYLFPNNGNTGDLWGLMVKTFSGGAVLDGRDSADGIRRYAADGQFLFSFDLDDPTVQMAYDYANQAFFTARAAAAFQTDGGLKDGDVAADIDAALDGRLPTETEERPVETEERPVGFDLGSNAPHWVLSAPGAWISSDMQKDLGSVGLRELMTDHSIRAVTESGYNLATTMLQVFGCDCYPGDRVRRMELTESHLGRNERGDLAYVEKGADIIRFSHTTGVFFGTVNFGARRDGEPMTHEDLQMVNFALQGVRGMVGGDRSLVTGIRLGNLTGAIDHLTRDPQGFFAPSRVMHRVRHGYEVSPSGGKVLVSSLDKALYQLLLAVPRDIIGGGNVSVRDVRTGACTFADSVGDGLYGDLIAALASGARAAQNERSEADKAAAMERALLRGGFAERGGSRTPSLNLAIRMSRIRDAWAASQAVRKLEAAGRPKALLSLDHWVRELSRETRKLNAAAAKSSYLRLGSGSAFTLAGTQNFWFHGGTGAHQLDVQRYRTALELLRETEPSSEDALRRNHEGLFDTLGALGAGRAEVPAFGKGPGTPYAATDAQLRYLADLLGRDTSASSGFTVDGFVEDVRSGRYAVGGDLYVPGAELAADATVLDLAVTLNRLIGDAIVEGANAGGALTASTRRRLADMDAVNRRLADALSLAVKGDRIAAQSDLDRFRRTGETGTSWTAPEALLQMTRELVAAERWRGCLAQMLVSVDENGAPNYVVNPDENAVAVEQMPDEYWGALARFVIQRSRGVENLPSYDEGVSGVENMRNVYRAVRDNAKGMYVPLTERDAKIRPLFEGMLCRRTDRDSAGNVCDLTLTQGGEAVAYMKQLLGMPDGRTTATSALRQVERILSWSKLASVGFSAFFQIATAFESQAAASGFTQAFLGNLPGRTGAKLGRAIGRALGRKGGLGAFQSDALSFKDIVENINSNDPFMKEARELCDLVGMPLDQAVDPYAAENEANPGLTQGSVVKRDIEKLYRMMQRFGLKGAGTVKSFLNFAYQHPTDYTFNVVLNGVKLAVVAQTMRRLREECARGARPFDPVTELRRHAAYIDAEIGGIDPGRYAWATPQMQRILRLAMFSWQWTVGAWVAGSGEALSDAVFGGHSTTRASRQFALIRWMRMLGIVKFGVPLVLQMAVKLLARAMSKALPPPDDEAEEDETYDERMVPWMMWNNESKAGSLSFDITPLLKIARRVPGAVALKEADVPVISALVPAYVGGGRNTTGRRRYYMHFGKQSDEFFRYFDGPTGALNQLLSKGSTGLQAVSQLLFGHSLSGMPGDTDVTKPQVLLNMFLPFSWQGAKSNADTGVLAALGPVRMGQSKRSTRLRIVERLNRFVEDERANDPWSYGRNRRRLNLLCTDILREAQMNGVDPASIMTSALGDVAHVQYLKLMDSLPKDANSNDVDTLEAMKAIRALVRVNRKASDIKSSIVQKYEAAGVDVKRNPRYRAALWDLVRTMRQAPFRADADMKARFDSWFDTTLDVRYRRATQLDAKGGENFGNFLATDEVPDTLFGVPVVKDGYTDEDLAFFAEHPEAGGYYDLGGDEGAEPEPRGALGAGKTRGAYPGSLNNPGNVEKRKERRQGEVDSPHGRWAKFATPQDGLREMADVIRQIADVKLAEAGKDFTIRNFAEVYAPRKNRKGAKENDTDRYIRDISSYSGLDADTPLARDADSMAKLLRTVVRFESGYPHSQWFTDDEYRNAANKLRKTPGL